MSVEERDRAGEYGIRCALWNGRWRASLKLQSHSTTNLTRQFCNQAAMKTGSSQAPDSSLVNKSSDLQFRCSPKHGTDYRLPTHICSIRTL